MLVGVISDTHDNFRAVRSALDVFMRRGVDLIIHCGDFVAPFTLKMFGESGVKLIGVFGNNDGEKVLLSRVSSELGFELVDQPMVKEIAGIKALIMHGCGSVERTVALAEELVKSFDLVVYGHTHLVNVKRVGESLILNPGEAHGLLSGRATVALLELPSLSVEVVEISF